MAKKNRDYELLLETIGEEIAKELSDSEMKILEDTLYSALILQPIPMLKKLQNKVLSMPKYKRAYLNSRFKFKAKADVEEMKIEPRQEDLTGFVA